MTRQRKYAIGFSIVFLLFTGYFLPDILWKLGFYVTNHSGGVASYLVSHHRPASDCGHITYLNLTPSPWEVRVGCRIEYAMITHDPDVCRGLLPTPFASDCVNYVTGQEFREKNDPEAANVEYEECRLVRGKSLKHDNCLYKYAVRSHESADCDAIENRVIHAACRLKTEAWRDYPKLRSSL